MKHRRVVGSSARYAQRGDLWKAFRRTMITGSVAGVLVHRGKKDTTTKSEIFKSYTDKAYVRRESDVGTLSMSYGTNHEKRAVQHYLKMIETNYLTNYPGSSVSVTHEDVDFYIHSSGMLPCTRRGSLEFSYRRLLNSPGDIHLAQQAHAARCSSCPRRGVVGGPLSSRLAAPLPLSSAEAALFKTNFW